MLVKAGIEWQPFSESAMAELPRVADPSQWTVPQAEVSKRRDLRSADYLICSIDPPGVLSHFSHFDYNRTNIGSLQCCLHLFGTHVHSCAP